MNRGYDLSNCPDDLQGTRHVAVNFSYSFKAENVLFFSLDHEEDPHDEVWDHEEEERDTSPYSNVIQEEERDTSP